MHCLLTMALPRLQLGDTLASLPPIPSTDVLKSVQYFLRDAMSRVPILVALDDVC